MRAAAVTTSRATAPGGRQATADLVLLLLAGAVIIGAGLGLREPWAPDEPRYALIARDLLASGDWLFPSRGGELYSDKPPLFFWIMAAALWATGSLRDAFLIPSLIAGLVTLGLVHDLARRLWGGRTGLAAGVLLLVTMQFVQHAKSAHIDALLCMWTTLSLYGLLRHLLCGPAWGWYLVGWTAAGLGIMTKGVGFLGLLALLPYAWARWRRWDGVVRAGGWRWFAGAGAMVVPLALWLVPMLVAVQASGAADLAAYRDDLLLRQTVQRYTGAWGHVKPWWYFLVQVIPLFWLPLTALLPWLVPAWARDLRARDARTLVLLGVALLVVLFFTFSTGKRGVYVLPALPPLVLAAAPHLRGLLARRPVQVTGLVLTGAVALLLPGGALYLWLARPPRVAALATYYGLEPALVLLAFGTLAALALLAARGRDGALACGGAIVGSWLLASFWLYPALDPVRSSASLMRATEAALEPGEELAIVRYREQFLLHAQRPITHFGYRRADTGDELRDAIAWLRAAPRRRLLVDDIRLEQCFLPERVRQVGFASDQQWYLAGGDAAASACEGGGSAARVVVYDPAPAATARSRGQGE